MPGRRSGSFFLTQIVYTETFLGEEVVVKERFKKEYRHPELDRKLVKKRIVAESRGMDKARQCGVNTPALHLVDQEERVIKMQYLKNHEPAKYFIERKSTQLSESSPA